MKTPLEENLRAALAELENAVKSMPTANPKPNLLPIFSRIDELMKQLPRDTDPQLLHYLHKKSYEKARLWLQDRDAENQAGNCRHV
jgi:Tfp pilus assembly protein PilO